MKKFLKGLGFLGVFVLVVSGCLSQKEDTPPSDTQPSIPSYEEPKPSADESVPSIEEQEAKEREEVADDKKYYDEAVANNDPSKCEFIKNDLVKDNCLQNVKSAEQATTTEATIEGSAEAVVE